VFVATVAALGLSCGKEPTPTYAKIDDAGVGTAPASRDSRPRVLLVHSYHTSYAWVDSVTRGVRMGLSPKEVDLEVFYMDTKRRSDEGWKLQRGAEARALVEEWNPEIVILVDDNAQQYLGKYLVGAPRPRLVFCGVNAEPSKYGYTPTTATGIIERPHIRQTFELVHRLLPDARRVLIVTDDNETTRGVSPFLTDLPPPFEAIEHKFVSTLAAWQETIENGREGADVILVYTYHTLMQNAGAPDAPNADPKLVLQWTVAHSPVPLIGALVFNLDDGALCGLVESGVEQGRAAAEYVTRLLHGSELSQLPVKVATQGQSMLNLSAARHWGITPSPEVLSEFQIVKDN
jgi:ABC-type uncharacterized transport system substrate-binding protein